MSKSIKSIGFIIRLKWKDYCDLRMSEQQLPSTITLLKTLIIEKIEHLLCLMNKTYQDCVRLA